MYVRLCEGLQDYGKLIPTTDDVYKHVTNMETDHYVSVYKYNEDQKKQFEETNSVAGIRDVVTNKIIFDLDSPDLKDALQDTKTLIDRLEKRGIGHNSIEIYMSGNKGFHIQINTDQTFSPSRLKKLALAFAHDLNSFDSTVYNANRILRLAGTKHPKSGLYKRKIAYNIVKDKSVEDILKMAEKSYPAKEAKEIHLSKSVLDMIKTSPEPKKTVSLDTEESYLSEGLDLSKRPSYLSPWKYAIEQGFFPVGSRNDAILILASTYKTANYDKTKAYHSLKAACEKQAKRFNIEKVSSDEIYSRIDTVFGEGWTGGCYAEDNFPLKLQKYLAEDMGIPRRDEIDLKVFESTTSVFSTFTKFAKDIDKNTIKTGISTLDENVRMTTGMLCGLLGAPSSGKCHGKGTEILMYNGTIKKVENVEVGDLLMGNDSTPRKVLSLARGNEELFKVITDDKHYVVNKSHILSLKNSQESRYLNGIKPGEVANISVAEFLDTSPHFQKRMKGYRSAQTLFKHSEPEMSPYLVGSWIGDGTFSNANITNQDGELEEVYRREANKYNVNYKIRQNKDRCQTHVFTGDKQINPFLNYLRENCKLDEEKRLPRGMMINSLPIRKELLAGILDTDGYYDKETDTFELTLKHENTIRDVQFLCRSIGLKCSYSKCERSIKSLDFTGTYYRAYITGDYTGIPFEVSRKKLVNRKTRNHYNTYTINLESIGEGDYYGFELDGNHLYCLADFTVTHNTNISLEILKNTSMKGEKSAFFSMDMGGSLVFQRLAQKLTGHNSDKLFQLFKTNQQAQIEDIKSKIDDNYKNVSFSFKTAMTVEDIKSSLLHQQEKTGEKFRLVVIDYLECIMASISDPTARIAMISQQLKDLANDLDTCVLLLLQPPKRVGDPSEPILSYTDIKGSATVAQACSVVMSLWREGFSPKMPENDLYMSFAVLKNRMGTLSQADCAFDGLTGKISDLDDVGKSTLQAMRSVKKLKDSDDI